VYLASAPKSNRSTIGLIRAGQDVRTLQAGAVPADLRQQHPYQRNKLKEGGGYVYPHDEPGAFFRQGYRPPEVEGRVYYVPGDLGEEADVGRRLKELWGEERYDVPAPKGKAGLSADDF
jgi:putative ATPase